MKVPASITVRYWFGGTDFDGVPEFGAELAENYAVSLVRPRRAGLGGGLGQLWIEFVSQLTLAEVVRVLLEGAAYDLIKSGSNAFFIRPFLDAYKRFKAREKNSKLDIDHIRFVFQDLSITVERLPNTNLLADLQRILTTLAEHFNSIVQASNQRLFEIYIPIFEDKSPDRVCIFRTLLSVDETIDIRTISSADYFKFWGLEYELAQPEVYAPEGNLIIKEPFYTESRYVAAKVYAQKRQ